MIKANTAINKVIDFSFNWFKQVEIYTMDFVWGATAVAKLKF